MPRPDKGALDTIDEADVDTVLDAGEDAELTQEEIIIQSQAEVDRLVDAKEALEQARLEQRTALEQALESSDLAEASSRRERSASPSSSCASEKSMKSHSSKASKKSVKSSSSKVSSRSHV